MMDLGLNRYSYAIMSHPNKVSKETQREARFFTQPLVAIECSNHKGTLGSEYSFLTLSDSSVIVRAIKKAENSDEIIIRLNESSKEEIKNFTLSIGNGIESAKEVYASEEFISDATVKNRELVTSFAPYEIKSFALKLKNPDIKNEKQTTYAINLDYNKNIITKQGEKGDFEYTIPYEITPKCFTVFGAEHKINKDSKNVLTCNKQKIAIPENSKKLTLICASLGGDKNAEFNIDGETVKKFIPDAFERIARWDMYDFKETARIKDCSVAFESTHCHKDGEDVFAKLVYFFAIAFDVKGKNELVLPEDSDILILSAVASDSELVEIKTPLLEEVPKRKFTFKMTDEEKQNYKFERRKSSMNDKAFHERKGWVKDY
jgi:alpha-mannosidase